MSFDRLAATMICAAAFLIMSCEGRLAPGGAGEGGAGRGGGRGGTTGGAGAGGAWGAMAGAGADASGVAGHAMAGASGSWAGGGTASTADVVIGAFTFSSCLELAYSLLPRGRQGCFAWFTPP